MYPRKMEVDLSTFDPTASYSQAQLSAFADAMLAADRKESGQTHDILFDDQLHRKRKHEWLVDAQRIDPAFSRENDNDNFAKTRGDGQAMYWRRHPQGRKVNTEEQRDKGASFYA